MSIRFSRGLGLQSFRALGALCLVEFVSDFSRFAEFWGVRLSGLGSVGKTIAS